MCDSHQSDAPTARQQWLGRAREGDAYVQDACAFAGPRALCARAAAGGAGQDLLLDFARLARRSGLDLFPRRREHWAKDTGKTVKTSFHNGDVASQQEAIRSAIAAKADGIVTTSPDPGSLVQVVNEARAAHIPIINFNTPDPKVNFNAYVGGDLPTVGKGWAQYLVDHKLVKSGDFVWMPVEVPGATYGVVEETKAITSVFKPLDITWEVTDNTLDQATSSPA